MRNFRDRGPIANYALKNVAMNPMYNFVGKPPPPLFNPVTPRDIENSVYLNELYAIRRRKMISDALNAYGRGSKRTVSTVPLLTSRLKYRQRPPTPRKPDQDHQQDHHYFIQIIIALLCLAGCILQIWSLSAPATDGYFAYDVVTSVTVAYKEVIDYPTRTFCFYTMDVINWTSVWNNGPPESRMTMEEMFEFMERVEKADAHNDKLINDALIKVQVTAREILDKTMESKDIFGQCSFIKRSNYTILSEDCGDVYDTRKFLLKAHTCYEMYPKKHREYEMSKVQLVYAYNPGMMASISLKESFFNKVRQSLLYIHDVKELPSSQNSRSLIISDMKSRIFSVTYTEYESEFLPKPYPSNCRNYSQEGYGTRVNCITSCVANRTRARLNYNSLLIPVNQHPIVVNGAKIDTSYLDMYVLSDIQLLNNQTLFNESRAISESCNKFCAQVDCDDVNIVPVLLSSNGYPINLYTFHMSYEPDVTTRTIEKMGVTSYLSDISSALGFWLGLSLLSLLEQTTKIMRKIIIN